MNIAELGMWFALFVMGVVTLLLVFCLWQAGLAARHRRDLELIEAQKRPCPHLHYPQREG
jgi:heme/copper-type cytochrome/quinol oxidase subunit 2